MSRLESLESEVGRLSPEELRRFRDWFLEFDAELWDKQIESDARSGKLDGLAEKAKRDYDSGNTTEL